MLLNRRSFIAGLIAAPAIVRVQSIMPVRSIGWLVADTAPTSGFVAAIQAWEDLLLYGNPEWPGPHGLLGYSLVGRW
jgi:hypothetical protein